MAAEAWSRLPHWQAEMTSTRFQGYALVARAGPG